MRSRLWLMGAIAAIIASSGLARDYPNYPNYPNKPIRLIAETAAGGPPDAVIRGLADRLTRVLGQPVVIENRSGGQGVVAALALMQSPADGYTMLQMGSPAAMLTPILSNKPAFDTLRDFAPLVQIGVSKAGLAVHPSIPANSIAELLEMGRARPGKIIWGTAGPASTAYLLMAPAHQTRSQAQESGLSGTFASRSRGITCRHSSVECSISASSMLPSV